MDAGRKATDMASATEHALNDLARQVLEVSAAIEQCLEDRSLSNMERSVQHSELQARYCYLRQRQFALMGDPTEELKWSTLAEKWEGRKKVAVAARAQDLLPKILDRQTQNASLNSQLDDLDEDDDRH